MSMQVAQSVNANIKFEYLMAGHDLALIKSQEKAEDDVVQSIDDLKAVTDNDPNCTFAVYIGITCGMSAPYVGSQVDWILHSSHPSRIRFMTILMGFNDVEMSRKTPIEGFNKTMYQVISELSAKVGDGRHYILNPIVGPEPVAGSSRMKGGSITKLLLEMIAVRVLHRAFETQLPLFTSTTQTSANSVEISPANTSQLSTSSASWSSHSSFVSLIDFFERVNRWTYVREREIAQVVEMAGESLKQGGHVYYIGEASIAIIALIDASECPPTYGAEFSDVRGFVPGGWETMNNIEGDMSSHGINYQISDLDFLSNFVPSLSERDLLVVLHVEGQCSDRLNSIVSKCLLHCPNLKRALVSWSRSEVVDEKLVESVSIGAHSKGDFISDAPPSSSSLSSISVPLTSGNRVIVIPISLPSNEIVPGLYSPVEISAKWICNAISTGAHVLKGKVWSNRMIDLTLSNDKLFRRGIDLVQSLLCVPTSVAHHAILRSIHRVDTLTEHILQMPISQHYQQARKHKRVVPIAILLASGKYDSIAQAEAALSRDSILRNIIADIVCK